MFISAKPDNFIAGADINMIARAQSAQEAEDLARQGQQVMAEIHSLPIPAIAAIHGACLGLLPLARQIFRLLRALRPGDHVDIGPGNKVVWLCRDKHQAANRFVLADLL